MGATGSVQANGGSSGETRCNPQQLEQEQQSNTLPLSEEIAQCEASDKKSDMSVYGEEQWLKQIQDLGKVVQNLASENMKLVDLNKKWKQRCEELEEEKRNEIKYMDDIEQNENKVTIEFCKEEAMKDKAIIEELKQQLRMKSESTSSEIQKYHEDVNYMKMKLKEYEQVACKLERDAESQQNTIQSLQNSICSAADEKKMLETNISKLEEECQRLKQKFINTQEEKSFLCKQMELERKSRDQILQENKKLHEDLEKLKEERDSNVAQKGLENSDESVGTESESYATAATATAEIDVGKNGGTKVLSSKAAAELEVFQKQLRVKREARHKALSAISEEMEKLRRELNTEREAKQNLIRELQDLRNLSTAHHMYDEVNDLKKSLSTAYEAKDKMFKEMVKIQKQGNEEIENILKDLDKEKQKNVQILKENKFIKEQLEETDQVLQLRCDENNKLQEKLETDKQKYQHLILALKEVITLTKQMLSVRENQVSHLQQTIQDIEASVIQKRHGSLTADLKMEYESQIQNMKTLKSLYEERASVMSAEKEKLIVEQKKLQNTIEEEKNKVEDLELKLHEKNVFISERNATVLNLQDELSDALDQSRNLSQELTLINNMFTQILGSNDVDLDKLTKLLQENHDLITEITTKGECSETTASLPKLLLDLVSDIEEAENKEKEDTELKVQGKENGNSETECECKDSFEPEQSRAEASVSEGMVSVNASGATLAMQDISSNLPKVWRVLLELVSHHVPSTTDETTGELKSSCYKSVDTPHGPKNVISVSKTFLRLRDLIVQKISLQKEVTRLKQLNVHLETKLNDQERRLSFVSTELRKTWNVVDHMRIQHQQLHTQEKVLIYELQQKRKMLNELKEELEYCRETWNEARQKNSQSEIEWEKLRTEFALRKSKPINNSGESGFSDEKEDDVAEVNVRKIQHSPHKTAEEGFPKPDSQDALSNSLLPDLVSATSDKSVSPSEAIPDGGILVTNNNATEDIIPNLQNMVEQALSFCNSSAMDSSFLGECPTASLITLLKQQLSCFSKNLDIISAGFDSNDHLRALQSIFALPAIQIPDHLNSASSEASSLSVSTNIESEPKNISSEDNAVISKEKNNNTKHIAVENFTGANSGSSERNTIKDKNNISSTNEPPKTCRPQEGSSGASKDSFHQESRAARIQRLERQSKELFDKVIKGTVGSASDKEKETKSTEDSNGSSKSLEDMLDARAERLKRLEEQSQQLYKKVKRTTHRSEALSNRLEELHEHYGSEDAPNNDNASSVRIPTPPPLPNHLMPSGNQTSNEVAHNLPSTSQELPSQPRTEEILDARAARLKRLEEQSQQLFKKVKQTTHRSEALSNRLEELHEHYGSDDVATPSNNIPLSLPSTEHLTTSCDGACGQSSTSNRVPTPPPLEDILDARSARLKRLEEQSLQLFKKVKGTTQRSEALSNRLEELHEQYGSDVAACTSNDNNYTSQEPTPTPMPIPNQPIPSETCTSSDSTLLPPTELRHKDASDSISCNLSSQSASSDRSVNGVSSPSVTSLGCEQSPAININLPLENNVIHEECDNCCIPSIASQHIPPPPPLPLNLPTFLLPCETNDATMRHDTLERIQNAADDPT